MGVHSIPPLEYRATKLYQQAVRRQTLDGSGSHTNHIVLPVSVVRNFRSIKQCRGGYFTPHVVFGVENVG